MLEQGNSFSRQKMDGCFFLTNFTAECEMVFVLTQENASS